MNILSGLYKPDSGEILIDGSPRAFSDPRQAIDAGIGMVHQHFQLVPVFDVVEAVALGAESVSGSSAPSTARPPASASSSCPSTYSLNVNPDAKIEDLPVGVRQRVEILKALYRKSDILVLDEPSAVLTPFETEELFGIIRGLAEAGTTVIFITHKLNEVLEVADKITVLRRGRVAGTADPKTATREQLANLMVGRDVELQGPQGPGHARRGRARSIKNLHVRDDRGHMAVQDVNLEVRAGEIVALAGVQGNGQTELVEAIVGLRHGRLGRDQPRRPQHQGREPAPDLERGRGAHPRGPQPRRADRLHDGRGELHPRHRTTASRTARASGSTARRSTQRPSRRVKDYDVRTPGIDDLRGLAVRRQPAEGRRRPRVQSRPLKLVIAAQPTRGLDVGSIEYIHKRIVEQRDQGAAILIVSTELDEVLAVGDRVAVMQGGQIVGIVEGEEATYEKVGMLMGGVH